ncbi:MAG: DUF192 domain-containing protein [Bacteroidota bacterium]|jgi:uncharacterized membrane protein (UPF0127 family)
MSNKNNSTDQHNDTKPKSRRRMQIGISFTVIVIALVIIFMPKKTATDTLASPMAPMFKKQGECTITNREDKPIVSIDIEIADDDSKREVGMMGRPTMEERQGMLFVFEEEQMASFWMKNCILPLDMIFINKLGEIVTICKNTTPFSEQAYSATAMTLLVLEVNAGFTDKYSIKEGDRISWKRN